MSKAIFQRVQDLLEQTQDKIRKAEVKWQDAQVQIRAQGARIHILETQVASLRAQAMTAVEKAGRTSGDHSHSGD